MVMRIAEPTCLWKAAGQPIIFVVAMATWCVLHTQQDARFLELRADGICFLSLMAVSYALQGLQDSMRGFGCMRLPTTVHLL